MHVDNGEHGKQNDNILFNTESNFCISRTFAFFERLMGFFFVVRMNKIENAHVDVRKDTALCISTNYLYYLLIIILSHLLSFISRFGVC